MRDRLIELIKNAKVREQADLLFSDIDTAIDMPSGDEYLANYLLANGVIVPPCKVGDTVYVISETRAKETKVDTIQIGSRNKVIFVNFECDDDCEGCPFEAWSQSYCGEWDCGNQYGFAEIKADDFGKTVFLTKEEAEQALKEKGNE